LQWYKKYCAQKRCLACAVGQEILIPTWSPAHAYRFHFH
jgi:hypothetical protein